MLRSLYSGISGMRVNQTKMDVIGNNVANVGTTAFKSARVRFQDMLSQNMSSASSPSRNQGGVNGAQVGLGVQVSGIDTLVKQGMMQPTGRNLDIAVDGPGYFMVGRGALPTNNAGGALTDINNHTLISGNGMAVNYTRDGALALDYDGNLLTSDGFRVLGYVVKEKTGYNSTSNSIDWSKNGICEFVDTDSKAGVVAGDNLVPLRIPESVHVNAALIKAAEAMDLDYTGTGENGKITTSPKIHTFDKKYLGKEDLKIEVKYDATAGAFKAYLNGDTTGKALGDIDVDGDGTNDINIGTPALDASISTNEDKAKYTWSFTVFAETDKKVRSFAIEKNGLVKGVLEDGKVTVLGQVAMASFKNPEGLEKMGKNLWSITPNSGQAIIRSGIGSPKSNDDGYGDTLQGNLEMSNVDLAEQFTDMIVTSRAFQASSKMISTGDEILQEIINLKR